MASEDYNRAAALLKEADLARARGAEVRAILAYPFNEPILFTAGSLHQSLVKIETDYRNFYLSSASFIGIITEEPRDLHTD